MALENRASHTLGPDNLRSGETSLAGRTAILTGGSRDIGAAIVKALAQEGVTVVFSYREKGKRADEVVANVLGSGGVAMGVQADISTPDGREAFVSSAIGTLGDRIDFLILSSSGPTDAINRQASNDLLGKALPHLKDGGVVIRMQSVPSHFGPQIRDTFSLARYNNVAIHKYDDLHSLRARMPEMRKQGVRFIEVCPPIVSDTTMIKLLNWQVDKETQGATTGEAMHDEVTLRLGLPQAVLTQEVGAKVVELLRNPDIKHGHTEFFNGMLDAQTALEHLYGVHQVYVNTLKREGEIEGQRSGIGRAIASIEQATRPNEPKMIDAISHDADGNYVGSVRITPQHAEGHFAQGSGFPRILPGHKQIRAAVETIGMIEKESGNSLDNLRLTGFENTTFSATVSAQGDTELTVKPVKNADGTYDVEISRQSDGKQTAFIRKLRVMPTEDLEEPELLEDQLLEGAAQSTGIVALEDLDSQTMPLLLGIGRTEFLGRSVKAGDGIKYDVHTKRVDKRGIEGSVLIYSGDRIIGVTAGIRAILVPKPVATRLLASHA